MVSGTADHKGQVLRHSNPSWKLHQEQYKLQMVLLDLLKLL